MVMCVFLPVGLSPGTGPKPGVDGGLGAGVERREGISGRRRPPIGLFRIDGEGRSSGSARDSDPVAVDETEVLLLFDFLLSRSTSSTNWICRFINFFGPLVGGGLTMTSVSLTPLFFLLLFIPPSPSLKTSSSPSPLSADLSYRLTVAVLGVESVPLDESATTEPGGRCVKVVTWG